MGNSELIISDMIPLSSWFGSGQNLIDEGFVCPEKSQVNR